MAKTLDVQINIFGYLKLLFAGSGGGLFSVMLPAVHRETLGMTLWDTADPLGW